MDTSIRTFAAVLSLGALYSSAAQYAGWAAGNPADGYGTIAATFDSGATWVRQGSGQVANVFLSVCAVDPLAAWAVGDADNGYATVYRTGDGGTTWTRKGFGQPALFGKSLGKVHASSGTVWAVGTDAILRSTDEGTTWTNLFPAQYASTHLQGVFSVDGDVVWVGGEGSNGTPDATLLHSTNAGMGWVQQVMTQANHILGICAVDRRTAWAVGGSGFVVFRTDDGGGTWQRQPSQGGVGDANEVSAAGTQVVYVAVDNFIEWTTNGGQHWASHTALNYVMGISAVDGQEAWAVNTGGISGTGTVFHTANGGATWEEQGLVEGMMPPLWNVSFARTPVPEPTGILAVLIVWLAARRAGAG